MTDERPSGIPADELAVHVRLTGSPLDRELTAMASQTGPVMAKIDPAIYAVQVAEEAFVDAPRPRLARQPAQPHPPLQRSDLVGRTR